MATLPEELLDQICRDLIWTLDQSECPKSNHQICCLTLFNFMLSSKTFHRLARPALYHSLIIGEPGHSKMTLVRLVELCVADPEIASSVKHLDLGDHPSSNTLNTLSRAAQSLAASPLYGPAFDLSSISDVGGEEEFDEHAAYTNDTLAALLLLLCPNLTFLRLSHLSSRTPHLSRIISYASSRSHPPPQLRRRPLQRVQHVRAFLPSASRALVLQDQTPILSLPSLLSFTGTGFSAARGLRHFHAPLDFRASPLRRMALRRGVLDWTGLEGIVVAFPELVDLDVEVAEMGGTLGQCRVDFANLGGMLRRIGGRLERFSFGCHPASLRNDRRGEPVGSLRGMERLRVLRVVWDGIFGSQLGLAEDGRHPPYFAGADDIQYLVDVLPRSLRGFRLWDGPSGGPDDSVLRASHRQVLAEQLEALTGCEEFGELCTIVLPGLLGLGMPVPQGWRRVRNCGAFVIVKEGKEIADGVLEDVKEMELTTAHMHRGKMKYELRRTS